MAMTTDPAHHDPGSSSRVGAFVATLLAGALLALVLAHWTWQVLGPARTRIAAAAPDDPAATIVASGLFGRGAAPSAAAGPADAAPSVLGNDVRLLGVFAEAGGRGYALLRMVSGPRLVAAGQEIVRGVTLASVQPDGIVVREAGIERAIALRVAAPPPAATGVVSSARAAQSARVAAARGACAPPAGFKGPVLALNGELMGGLIAQPDSWRALIEPMDGALVVADDSGFSAMLGLKRGDRIEQANGIALQTPDDVIGAVLRPLASNQPVRLTGSRGGQPHELWLRNAGCS